jgi:hypothetical protein
MRTAGMRPIVNIPNAPIPARPRRRRSDWGRTARHPTEPVPTGVANGRCVGRYMPLPSLSGVAGGVQLSEARWSPALP